MSRKLFVKICGITRPQDAELASALGASALGFMFWQGSPRCIDPDVAGTIGEVVPRGVMKVGVFVDEPVEQIARIVEDARLDAVQLHGHETPEYCRQLARRLNHGAIHRMMIKAVSIPDDGVLGILDFGPGVTMLVDTHDAVRRGGTGRTGNWDRARDLALVRPTILAGGLNAANVRLAVRSVQPYGVDVSSGVESTPGIKDPTRMRTFFEALHD